MSIDRVEAAPFEKVLSLFGFGAAMAGLPGRIIVLDVCERVLIATIYGAFAWRMLADFSGTADVSTVLIVLSEALPLIFVMLRLPSATLSQRPTDWAAAITATIAPLLVRPTGDVAASMGLEAVAYGVMLFGLCLQVGAKAILGRCFGIV